MVNFYGPGNRPYGNEPGDICVFGDGVYLATDEISRNYLIEEGYMQVPGSSDLFESEEGKEIRLVREKYRKKRTAINLPKQLSWETMKIGGRY